MKRALRTTIWMSAGVVLTASTMAVTEDAASRATANTQKAVAAPANLENSTLPYGGIVERNVFNLHPPPTPEDPSALAKKNQQIPKLTLNGITTILGKKIVFITEPPTKPGEKQQTLMLSEGEAQDEVEVKTIDESAGVTKVVNHGEEQTLDFDHNGVKPAATGSNPAIPTPIPASPPPNVNGMPRPSQVMRPMRNLLPAARTTSDEGEGGGIGGGMTPSATATATASTAAPLTQEQVAMIIEAQRMKANQEGDPIAKILPPTAFSDQMQEGGAPAPQ